jgi:hypothetical protein
MSQNKMPLYAIVELLIRLSAFNNGIGNYKNHAERGDDVVIKTTNGSISLSKRLILSQFHTPDDINKRDLELMAMKFRMKNLLKKGFN